ncbi:MAG: YqgE/AlgH family protein [Thermoflexibacter sp.]|jgi:putative transcriptional regulator|nr:YqgE/AlgH family protein [Thermoflexibacter sp.]
MIEGLSKNLNTDLKVETGYLLISEPFLPDPNFERSVVLICDHKPDTGSFGFILNKPTDISVAELIEAESVQNTVFLGGPVEQNTLHFIHTFDTLEDAIPLKNGVFWGGNFDQLRIYADSGMVNSSNCRFFMGYSGWGKQQLHSELEQNSWIISKINLHQIFQIPPEELWRSILRTMGGRYKVFASFPDDPRLN